MCFWSCPVLTYKNIKPEELRAFFFPYSHPYSYPSYSALGRHGGKVRLVKDEDKDEVG